MMITEKIMMIACRLITQHNAKVGWGEAMVWELYNDRFKACLRSISWYPSIVLDKISPGDPAMKPGVKTGEILS